MNDLLVVPVASPECNACYCEYLCHLKEFHANPTPSQNIKDIKGKALEIHNMMTGNELSHLSPWEI